MSGAATSKGGRLGAWATALAPHVRLEKQVEYSLQGAAMTWQGLMLPAQGQ